MRSLLNPQSGRGITNLLLLLILSTLLNSNVAAQSGSTVPQALAGTGFTYQGQLKNALYHNNGDGTFTDVTEKAGLASPHPRQTAVWFDYDDDGWLDLFLGNESSPWWLPGIKGGQHPVELYHNLGNGTFEEVSAKVGLRFTAWVKGAAAGDFDGDGYPDLYVSTFLGGNRRRLQRALSISR